MICLHFKTPQQQNYWEILVWTKFFPPEIFENLQGIGIILALKVKIAVWIVCQLLVTNTSF